ncbi:extracellular solute-binding protein [Gracilibacillus phocaeensis]|uniref:extracellular solute-binding protein n=1 Tax=Gracilibacillus phocaeensis TaxID=2042304 RepID=UPI00102FE61C|nr:extracellular solute-binding protein [Gracilibacillus phocaeensis]
MKSTFQFLFTIAIFMLLLSACNSEQSNNEEIGENDNTASSEEITVNKEDFPIVDDEITLSMMAPSTGQAEWKDMLILQEYAGMTNINFNFDTPPMSDFATKLNLTFASRDIADIIYGAGTDNLTPGMEADYGEQGDLLPLEGLIEEYAPNIQKMFDENPDIKKSVTTADGHIYSLPRVSEEVTAIWGSNPLWFNGRWLEALEVDELPSTTDEFYELLVRFRDEDPNDNGELDEIPLTDVKMDGIRLWFLGAFGLKEWGIEEVNGDVRYTPITENYKAYLEYMNKLYEENLLDPETFTQSEEQRKASGQDNRLGVFKAWSSFFVTGETEEEALNNPMLYPLTSEYTNEPLLPRNPGISRGAFSLSSSNEYPEASIRWVDWFYSQEGMEFLGQGPEGHIWEWADEEGGEKVLLDPPDGFDTLEEYRGTISPDFGISAPTFKAPIRGIPESDYQKFEREETETKIEPFAEIPFPLVYLTTEEQEKVNTVEVDLESYVRQMEAKFITGVEPFSSWESYIKTIENMNIDQYVQIHQEAYDRWVDS